VTTGDTSTPRARGGSSGRVHGVSTVIAATVIAGVAAYLITWLVPRQIGFASYAIFAVFWSFLYLVVSGLGGIQQEVARGTTPMPESVGTNRARNFGVVTAAVVFMVAIASAFLWVSAVFPANGWALVWPLALGTASYVIVAVLAGALFGTKQWLSIGALIVTDALMRLIAVGATLAFTHDVVALAWAVVLPFPLTVLVLWPFIRHAIVGTAQLDVSYGRLVANVTGTVVAAASTGVMVSGFPLVLGITAAAEPHALVGLFILSITLTRAPLIVIAMSLQSYLIVAFREAGPKFWSLFLKLQAIVLVGGAILALAGWLLGPAVFGFLFPGELQPAGWFIAVLVGSLCISAPAVLAKSAHSVYTAGWVVAALVTIVALLLPLDFTTRTVLALTAGPVAGLLLHWGWLVIGRRGSTSSN
jgi:hypothetical protein